MRVLIAVEDELFGLACVDYVASHQWEAGTMFKIMHAVEPFTVGDRITDICDDNLLGKIHAEQVEYGQQLVAQIKQKLEAKIGTGMPIETNVTMGRPHHIILQIAEKWNAKMIVMGSRGRKGFSKFFLGSVSLSVLSHAPCSVIIVRLPSSAAGNQAELKAEAREQATDESLAHARHG